MENTTLPKPKLRVRRAGYAKPISLGETHHAKWEKLGYYEAISSKTGQKYWIDIISSVAKDYWGETGRKLRIYKLTENGKEEIPLSKFPEYNPYRGYPWDSKILEMLANSIGHEVDLDEEWHREKPEN